MTPQFIAWYGMIFTCAPNVLCKAGTRAIDFSAVRVSVYLCVCVKKTEKTTDQKVT